MPIINLPFADTPLSGNEIVYIKSEFTNQTIQTTTKELAKLIEWGDIGGDIEDQLDLMAYLDKSFSIKVDGNPGSPVVGQFTYQDNRLIGATVIDIMVNKLPETVIDLDFTLNSVTGTITRVNQWQADDTAIIKKTSSDSSLAIKVDGLAGSPVAESYTYQNNILIGATVIDILVNKIPETAIDGDFTFSSVTGTITRVNPWKTDDTAIIKKS